MWLQIQFINTMGFDPIHFEMAGFSQTCNIVFPGLDCFDKIKAELSEGLFKFCIDDSCWP